MQPLQPQLQEIIDRIGQVNNILITVKANPSVDELSAALGLTIALNNSGKHATAVFSGQIPNAMSFLKPQKIFENNVHSLRDFIISLNKEKADKLRFAKDGEIVKIYITPYKSTITSGDLQYSEGDFNVQMVLAIGISAKEELDTVIAAHGRILHEATVATLMPGSSPSQLGSINWLEPNLSSASAMVVQLLQALNVGGGISSEIATALLTGIVADTDRFSNAKTSPRVMEISALLMNSGADHQLVTSSIGAVLGQTPKSTLSAPTPPPQSPSMSLPPITNGATNGQSQDLVLSLHENNTPAPQSTAATNTAPIALSPAETSTPTGLDSTSSNQILNQLLPQPQPQDPSQTVLPSELLPPAPQFQPAPTPMATIPSQDYTAPQQPQLSSLPSEAPAPNLSTQNIEPTMPSSQPTDMQATPTITAVDPLATPVGSTPALEADKIRSEIDQIFSAEPFNPANQPRQDLGSEIILPEEETKEEPKLDTPSVFVDTAVQQNQAIDPSPSVAPQSIPDLQPIQATKTDQISADEVLGGSTVQSTPETPAIPGIEKPPEITLPPPPPVPEVQTPYPSNLTFNPTQSQLPQNQ